MNISVSVAIIVKDEERCIGRCIDSIIGLFDEYIIVDSGSTDQTINIIQEKLNSEVSNYKIINAESDVGFSLLRNLAILNTSSDAVFFIDADEVLTAHKKQIYEVFSKISNDGKSNNIALCPIIENHDGNCINSIPRGFFISGSYEYIGYVHEELRKKDLTSIEYILTDIVIFHDGYREDIICKKNKLLRNLSLNLKNIEFEPNNLRWVYFYARDAFDLVDKDMMHEKLKTSIALDINAPLCKNNIIDSTYTLKIIDLIARLKLFDTESDFEFKAIIDLMDEISPSNSNSFFYLCLRPLLKWKKEAFSMLQEIAKFNQKNDTNHCGMLHSKGFHIDSLLALYLYESGSKNKAMEIFRSLNENGYRTLLTKEYIND